MLFKILFNLETHSLLHEGGDVIASMSMLYLQYGNVALTRRSIDRV